MPEEVSADKKALDLSGEMPLIEGMEGDEEFIAARDLASAFIKAIKAFRFYPADNPLNLNRCAAAPGRCPAIV